MAWVAGGVFPQGVRYTLQTRSRRSCRGRFANPPRAACGIALNSLICINTLLRRHVANRISVSGC